MRGRRHISLCRTSLTVAMLGHAVEAMISGSMFMRILQEFLMKRATTTRLRIKVHVCVAVKVSRFSYFVPVTKKSGGKNFILLGHILV